MTGAVGPAEHRRVRLDGRGSEEGAMTAWEAVGRRKLAGERLRDGGMPVRFVALWSALGLAASAVLLSAGFDLGAALLLLE
jgi:hypothetical protein